MKSPCGYKTCIVLRVATVKKYQKTQQSPAKRTVFICFYMFLRILGLSNAWCRTLEEEEKEKEEEEEEEDEEEEEEDKEDEEEDEEDEEEDEEDDEEDEEDEEGGGVGQGVCRKFRERRLFQS